MNITRLPSGAFVPNMIEGWVSWLSESLPGRIVLSTSPFLVASPFLLWSDRYNSFSRLLYLLVLCIVQAGLIPVLARGTNAYLNASASRVFVVISAVYGCLVLGVVYGVRFSNFALSAGLASGDTAIFEQALWNTIHQNGILVSTLEGGSHLAVHNSPFLFLLVPGYAIFSDTLFLFVMQTLAVMLCAWLLYIIASKQLASFPALLIATAFLLHPLTLGNQFYFHETFFAGLFFLLAVYFILAKRWGIAWLAMLLLLSVHERAALIVLGLCLVMWWKQVPRRWILAAFAAAVVSLLSTWLVLNAFRTPETLAFSFYYFRHLGATPDEIIHTVTTSPAALFSPLINEGGAKLLLWYGLTGPLFFVLPLGSIWILPMIPEALFNLLASDLNGLSWHYATILIGLFLGLVMTLSRLQSANTSRRAPQIVALSLAILTNTMGLLPVTINPEAFWVNPGETAQMARAVQMIPSEGVLCADANLIQYFGRRAVLYSNHSSPAEWLARCEYVILDRRNGEWNNTVWQTPVALRSYGTNRFKVLLLDERIVVLEKLQE